MTDVPVGCCAGHIIVACGVPGTKERYGDPMEKPGRGEIETPEYGPAPGTVAESPPPYPYGFDMLAYI
jgi:hypothetical protein